MLARKRLARPDRQREERGVPRDAWRWGSPAPERIRRRRPLRYIEADRELERSLTPSEQHLGADTTRCYRGRGEGKAELALGKRGVAGGGGGQRGPCLGEAGGTRRAAMNADSVVWTRRTSRWFLVAVRGWAPSETSVAGAIRDAAEARTTPKVSRGGGASVRAGCVWDVGVTRKSALVAGRSQAGEPPASEEAARAGGARGGAAQEAHSGRRGHDPAGE